MTQRDEVKIEFNGKKYFGTYKVEKGMVTVSTVYGSKTTQVGHSTPELLARIMLRELVEEGKA